MLFKLKQGNKMKYLVLFALLLVTVSFARDGYPDEPAIQEYVDDQSQNSQGTLMQNSSISVSVVGQGVAPAFAQSPAQSYALAKRAATADAYRLIAEKIKGVKIEGKDTIKNMMVKSSTVNTRVSAMVRNANVVETKFENGLCEVEMEITLNYNDFQFGIDYALIPKSLLYKGAQGMKDGFFRY